MSISVLYALLSVVRGIGAVDVDASGALRPGMLVYIVTAALVVDAITAIRWRTDSKTILERAEGDFVTAPQREVPVLKPKTRGAAAKR